MMLADLLPEYDQEHIQCIEMSLFRRNPINEAEYIYNSKRICHNIAFLPKHHVLKYIDLKNKYCTCIAHLNDEQMRGPDLQKVMDDERQQYERSLKLLYDKVEEGSVASMKQDAAITCKKCGSSEITMAMAQTRSADEGATVFFTCMRCNQKWKVQ